MGRIKNLVAVGQCSLWAKRRVRKRKITVVVKEAWEASCLGSSQDFSISESE